MPAVMANQYSVLDTSATSFAQHFYWSLAQGMSIGQSACEARISMNYSAGADIIDWAVPVLFTRVPTLKLCTHPATISSTPATLVSRDRRRSIQDRKIRVAVWDIDSAFPEIARTLDRLNQVQGYFGFELVSLSIPIRAWDLTSKSNSPDKKPYLWAERLVRQVKPALTELRVDALTCITTHWMRDNDTFNVYGTWSSNSPVTIFSCAGLELGPAGGETDRAIANVLVTLLAGFRSDIDSHKDGSETCPLYYNPMRRRSLIVGQLSFDRACRKVLLEKLSTHEVNALEALLAAYP